MIMAAAARSKWICAEKFNLIDVIKMTEGVVFSHSQSQSHCQFGSLIAWLEEQNLEQGLLFTITVTHGSYEHEYCSQVSCLVSISHSVYFVFGTNMTCTQSSINW